MSALHPPLTEHERVRVQMALAEAGYPYAQVAIVVHPLTGVDTLSVDPFVPEEVCWRAYTLIDTFGALACFECWKTSNRLRVVADCLARGVAVENCEASS